MVGLWGAQGSFEGLSQFSDPRVDVVLSVARAMRKGGHGGTLLIATKESCHGSIDCIEYKNDSESRMASEYLKYFIEARQNYESDKTNRAAEERFRHWENALMMRVPNFIAQLTTVDGATLLSSDLDVLDFGVRLKTASNPLLTHGVRIDPLEHDNWLEKVSVEERGWGTRHKSAAQFVSDNHDSLAIVASQDGNVTAYVWIEPNDSPSLVGVYAFERLELTLF
jgi:hypothetical protein